MPDRHRHRRAQVYRQHRRIRARADQLKELAMFRTRARELGGYDLSVTNTVRFVN